MAKKKITIYTIVFFIVFISVLNFRFIESQAKFYFSKDNGSIKISQQELGAYLLPVAGAPVSVLGQVSKDSLSQKDSGFVLNIPSLGIYAPIVIENSTALDIVYKRLQEGVVHYGTSPMPGEKGTSVILGHSSAYPWYRGSYGSVFALLNKLQPGDTFQIKKGMDILNYKVSESLVFSPFSDNNQLAEFENSDNSSVILVSCWPVGTNYKRLAVKAELI